MNQDEAKEIIPMTFKEMCFKFNDKKDTRNDLDELFFQYLADKSSGELEAYGKFFEEHKHKGNDSASLSTKYNQAFMDYLSELSDPDQLRNYKEFLRSNSTHSLVQRNSGNYRVSVDSWVYGESRISEKQRVGVSVQSKIEEEESIEIGKKNWTKTCISNPECVLVDSIYFKKNEKEFFDTFPNVLLEDINIINNNTNPNFSSNNINTCAPNTNLKTTNNIDVTLTNSHSSNTSDNDTNPNHTNYNKIDTDNKINNVTTSHAIFNNTKTLTNTNVNTNNTNNKNTNTYNTNTYINTGHNIPNTITTCAVNTNENTIISNSKINATLALSQDTNAITIISNTNTNASVPIDPPIDILSTITGIHTTSTINRPVMTTSTNAATINVSTITNTTTTSTFGAINTTYTVIGPSNVVPVKFTWDFEDHPK
eukprot:TRINITY_DN17286_c0_g2_i1.p1 TRINITY_DN17286_c0_g2~~TRINITY_DN17286_c0_g2_i1.p1  ORF type:complete len:425 (+),score=86.64 TRINITY_DN17286_c0_g2_i1:504-1778(+)